MQFYVKNKKKLKFGSKNVLFQCFLSFTLKKYFYNWNQNSLMCQKAKFSANAKSLIWNRKCIAWVFLNFRLKLEKNYCHIWNQHSQICKNAKFHQKMKNLIFGTKDALCEYAWAVNFKNVCHIWYQYSQICQNSKFCAEIKICNFETKNILCECFWVAVLNTNVIFEISTRRLVKLGRFSQNIRNP